MIAAMSEVVDLQAMDEGQVRQMLASMLTQISARDATIRFKQALIDKLTHENAVLKRLKFGLKSERMNAEQRSLLDETLDADLAAVADEIALAQPESAAAQEKKRSFVEFTVIFPYAIAKSNFPQ